jgi:hypothetical protein
MAGDPGVTLQVAMKDANKLQVPTRETLRLLTHATNIATISGIGTVIYISVEKVISGRMHRTTMINARFGLYLRFFLPVGSLGPFIIAEKSRLP